MQNVLFYSDFKVKYFSLYLLFLNSKKNILSKTHNVNTGYKIYSKPLLISYPRSGTNWIRYVIEYLTNRPTPGENRLVRGHKPWFRLLNGGYIVDRAHNAQSIINNYSKIVLILRNYKECFLRQFQKQRADFNSVSDLLLDENLHTPCSWYINNIKAFEEFKGAKKKLYFEDMINKPLEFIDDLVEFLDLPTKKLNHLKENLSEHQNNSVGLYTKRGKKSFTNGNKNNLKLHSSSLSKSQLLEFDNFYLSNFPNITNKYLERYLEG